MAARYEGLPVIVEMLEDGRLIKLRADVAFHDDAGEEWPVPAEAVVDGASIPRILWTIIGSPLTGLYRDASVIHDWYCDLRTRTWEATHRMFYEAMIVSGVSEAQAKVMFFAVWWRGPRWEKRVSLNTNLGGTIGLTTGFSEFGFNPGSLFKTTMVDLDSPGHAVNESDQADVMQQITALIENQDVSLDDIEALAEKASPGR